jgi:hypothetical protein
MGRLDSWIAEGKEIKKLVKAAITGAKKRLTPEEKESAAERKASRPVSEKAAAWTEYVAQVHEELKAADPKAKRSTAMAVAKERRASGLAPLAPVEAVSGKMSDDEKAAKKADREAAKAAKAEEAARAKEDAAERKAAAKAEKEAAKAAEKAAKETEKAEKEAAKAAAKAAKEQAAAEAKASKAATKGTKPAAKVAASAPAPAPVEEEEEETLSIFKHKGKEYLRSSRNECWDRDAKGGMGKWAGVYDPASNAIDASASEPEFN